MKRWLNKVLVVFVAVMTLGLYIPPVTLSDAEENKKDVSVKTNKIESTTAVSEEKPPSTPTKVRLEEVTIGQSDPFINELTKQAEEQTLAKLGPRIGNEVDDEITTVILPHMNEVIQTILTEAGKKEAPYYGITEEPTDGYGEKIFNLYDYRTKKDIALFHVRRDNRPLDGYWFNFHYHLSSDNFEKHYEIGDVYWDKNIPPKWMS